MGQFLNKLLNKIIFLSIILLSGCGGGGSSSSETIPVITPPPPPPPTNTVPVCTSTAYTNPFIALQKG